MKNKENQNILLNSYILISGKTITLLIDFVMTMIIIRILPITDYALLTIGYMIPIVFRLFGELGLDFASTHFISKMRRKKDLHAIRRVIRINLSIKMLFGILFLIIIALNAEFIAVEIYNINDERLVTLIQISSFLVFTRTMYLSTSAILLGFEKVKSLRFGMILHIIIRMVLSISLILYGFTLYGPMIASVLCNLIVALIFLILIKKNTVKTEINRTQSEKKIFSKMVKYGYPLMFFSIIASLELPLCIFILAIKSDLQSVSYFKTAHDSTMIILVLTTTISMIVFPLFSKMEWKQNEDKEELIRKFQSFLKFNSLLILPITFIVIMFSSDLFPILYGDKYKPAALFYSTYFIKFLFCTFGSLLIPEFLKGQKQTKHVFLIKLINIISIIILGPIFIILYSGIGIIFAIILGTFFGLIYSIFIIFRKYGKALFGNFKNILIIFTIALLDAIITFFIYNILKIITSSNSSLNTLFIIVVSSIIYLSLFLFLVGVFSQISIEELDLLATSFAHIIILNKIIEYFAFFEKKMIAIRKKNR